MTPHNRQLRLLAVVSNIALSARLAGWRTAMAAGHTVRKPPPLPHGGGGLASDWGEPTELPVKQYALSLTEPADRHLGPPNGWVDGGDGQMHFVLPTLVAVDLEDKVAHTPHASGARDSENLALCVAFSGIDGLLEALKEEGVM